MKWFFSWKKTFKSTANPAEKNEDVFFYQNAIFKNIPQPILLELYKHIKVVTLKNEHYLFRDGDVAEEFFIITKGSVEIIKQDTDCQPHILTVLHPGDTIGEMAFLDKEIRSTSVKAKEQVTLFSIPFSIMNKLIARYPDFGRIYTNISATLTKRLQGTNEVTIRALENQLREYKLRTIMSKLIISVVGLLCFFTFSLTTLSELTEHQVSSSFISFPIVIVILALAVPIIRNSHLPFAVLGLTTRGWKMALSESFFFTLPLFILVLIMKWLFMKYSPGFAHRSLFDPFIYYQVNAHLSTDHVKIWFVTLIIYAFIASPLQEFLVRGLLQGPLTLCLTGKHRIFYSILVSNLVFSTVHLYISKHDAILSFIAGLYLGWLYSRHETILGVCLAHIMLGVWTLWVVGM